MRAGKTEMNVVDAKMGKKSALFCSFAPQRSVSARPKGGQTFHSFRIYVKILDFQLRLHQNNTLKREKGLKKRPTALWNLRKA